jgi:hypothetical protein
MTLRIDGRLLKEKTGQGVADPNESCQTGDCEGSVVRALNRRVGEFEGVDHQAIESIRLD